MLEKTTYGYIREKFLIRGLPLIVADNESNFNREKSLKQFLDNISANMSEIIQQEACDLETNLMMSKYASVDESFSVLNNIADDLENIPPWFISFRNCHVKSVELFHDIFI